MMQVAMAALFALIISGWSAMTGAEKTAAFEQTAADATVAQFMDYRAAVIHYLDANPGVAEGVLNNGLIATHALPGVVIGAGTDFGAYWKKTPGGVGVAGPGLYVYSKFVVGTREASLLAKRMGGSIFAGLSSGGTTKYIISPVDNNPSIVLPAAANITPGSLVVFGR